MGGRRFGVGERGDCESCADRWMDGSREGMAGALKGVSAISTIPYAWVEGVLPVLIDHGLQYSTSAWLLSDPSRGWGRRIVFFFCFFFLLRFYA